jgi:hypothetical protein
MKGLVEKEVHYEKELFCNLRNNDLLAGSGWMYFLEGRNGGSKESYDREPRDYGNGIPGKAGEYYHRNTGNCHNRSGRTARKSENNGE